MRLILIYLNDILRITSSNSSNENIIDAYLFTKNNLAMYFISIIELQSINALTMAFGKSSLF